MLTSRTKNSFPTFSDILSGNKWLDDLWSDRFNTWSPSVNIKESDKGFSLEIAAPGIDKKDFQLNVEDRVLTVSYEHKEENEEKNDDTKYLRREFSSQSFRKTYTLPEGVDVDKIGATYSNGILTVDIPKVKEKSKLSKLINIS